MNAINYGIMIFVGWNCSSFDGWKRCQKEKKWNYFKLYIPKDRKVLFQVSRFAKTMFKTWNFVKKLDFKIDVLWEFWLKIWHAMFLIQNMMRCKDFIQNLIAPEKFLRKCLALWKTKKIHNWRFCAPLVSNLFGYAINLFSKILSFAMCFILTCIVVGNVTHALTRCGKFESRFETLYYS